MPLPKKGDTVWKQAIDPLPPGASVKDQRAWFAKDWHKGVVQTPGGFSIKVKWQKIGFVTEESPEEVSTEAPSSLVATASRGKSDPPPPPAPPPTSPSPAVGTNGVSPSASSDMPAEVDVDSSDDSSSSSSLGFELPVNKELALHGKQKFARNPGRYAAHCRLRLLCTC